MDKIGIIMPVLNLWNEFTKAALSSIFSQNYIGEYQVHIIDNGSDDATRKESMRLVSTNENVIYTRNAVNEGVAKSWNFGVEQAIDAGCDKFFILNNDILLEENAMSKLVRRLNKGGIGMATCNDIHGEKPENMNVMEFMRSLDKSNVEEAESPCFSAFMFTKDTWDKVGSFDETFYPAYFEDNDYHYRMKLAGIKAILHPTSLFYHFVSRTQNQITDRPIVPNFSFDRNRDYYIAKWGGEPGKEIFKKPFNK
jgi:GT2 family glycosyltransferase